MPYGYVYLTECDCNGLKYVGQHSGCFDPKYRGSGTRLRNSIRKYGFENFKVTLLEEFESKESLDQGEIDYISILNSYGAGLCNILIGGSGFGYGINHPLFGKTRPNSVKLKVSAAKIGKKRPPFSREWLENIRKAAQRRVGIKMNLSDEARRKISHTHLGKKKSKEWMEAWKASRASGYGWNHSDETKAKIKEKRKNQKIRLKQNYEQDIQKSSHKAKAD